MIRIEEQDFDAGREIARLTEGRTDVGAVVAFIGLVRDMADGRPISAMTLEHYPAMARRELESIEAEARRRWPLQASLVIHRFGALKPGDRIVLVAIASAHRGAAFEAAQFLMDWLKTKAPFWKREATPEGENWVGARSEDDRAAETWLKRS